MLTMHDVAQVDLDTPIIIETEEDTLCNQRPLKVFRCIFVLSFGIRFNDFVSCSERVHVSLVPRKWMYG